ncbi:MAG: flavocytochrome c [Berryella intestinalis]|uniref:flavocytochrome c n=1 Tax=Berryella intestinalis TaxID=1531429 RepID=UPI002A4E4A55|nr:flavocytochrome c [Berryella intestinalis]MDD7368631.1 flavocytochrome c [Berryella intestinalis]MDY3130061.1 flavocytochrome c [Berryella intestinalis]
MLNNTDKISRRSFLSGAFASTALAALSLAGCAPRSFESEAERNVIDGGSYDIVVVGAGGAGMAAAVSSVDAGAKVLLLEKMPVAGGNTCFAEGGMNVCCTKYQAQSGIEDGVDLMTADTYKGGHNKGNLELIRHMCANSNDALEWLGSMGIVLSKLGTSGGASVKRIHRPETGEAVGRYIVKGMSEQCRQRGISAVCNTKVEELLMEDGRIAGVVATDPNNMTVRYRAKAVIVATGGFGANNEMLAQYRPELLDAVTTNQPGSQGDGILFSQAIGADTVDIGEIQVHPTVEQTTATLLSENIRGDGAILINHDGVRFTNELLTRDVVSANEWKQPDRTVWAVFDSSVAENNTSIEEKFVARDLCKVEKDLESLGKAMGVPVEDFVKSVTTYNDNIASGTEDPLGRTKSLNPLVKAPFYAIHVAPGVHHCMGGLRVNAEAEVLDANGDAIPGLFAAGEVTGGIHGGNRLGGNAVCDINVNGLQAQKTAVAYLKTL